MSTIGLWEEGFVPEGWVRGQELRIVPALKNYVGYVSRSFSLAHSPLSMASDDVKDTVFAITFSYDQAKQIQRWLDWWRRTPQEAD